MYGIAVLNARGKGGSAAFSMIAIGKYACKMLDDGWTAVTRDRSLTAQFEHSIGITEDGNEIFTKSAAGLDCPPY